MAQPLLYHTIPSAVKQHLPLSRCIVDLHNVRANTTTGLFGIQSAEFQEFFLARSNWLLQVYWRLVVSILLTSWWLHASLQHRAWCLRGIAWRVWRKKLQTAGALHQCQRHAQQVASRHWANHRLEGDVPHHMRWRSPYIHDVWNDWSTKFRRERNAGADTVCLPDRPQQGGTPPARISVIHREKHRRDSEMSRFATSCRQAR